MSTTFSLFRRIARGFGKLKAAPQASTDGQLPHVDSVRMARPAQAGGTRVAAKGHRLQRKWQLHGEITQTPSNLM